MPSCQMSLSFIGIGRTAMNGWLKENNFVCKIFAFSDIKVMNIQLLLVMKLLGPIHSVPLAHSCKHKVKPQDLYLFACHCLRTVSHCRKEPWPGPSTQYNACDNLVLVAWWQFTCLTQDLTEFVQHFDWLHAIPVRCFQLPLISLWVRLFSPCQANILGNRGLLYNPVSPLL